MAKSTAVSKFAKKCLQKNLPPTLYFSKIDYRDIPRQVNADKRKAEQETLDIKIPKMSSCVDEYASSRGMSQASMLNNSVEEEKKFTFHNDVLKEDSGDGQIHFRHYIPFSKLRIGNCFCSRALLDS